MRVLVKACSKEGLIQLSPWGPMRSGAKKKKPFKEIK